MSLQGGRAGEPVTGVLSQDVCRAYTQLYDVLDYHVYERQLDRLFGRERA